ncbi:MAG: cobyric acid synthase [Oscillospiraceae bacterium]|nr:cobyric acid synthase [Oscillospiraceae bacterium]
MAKPIMIQGTASSVGKTILTMALCRIFKQDGYRVTPFKSQNMTSNTAILKTGEEMAVSQVLQAQAAGVEPDITMNPILLKYSNEKRGIQLILNGKLRETINAYNFKKIKQSLVPEIKQAYETLSSRYDIIVIEGAGSPVELNLNKDDIVNMGIARLISAPVLLVANIDRGGIFASLYGTVALLEEWERPYIKATVVNRFKGDTSNFKDGIAILEEITGVPVAGIVPHINFSLPEEDGPGGAAYAPDDSLEEQFDLIAGHIRKSLNMDLIYKILETGV